jgi:hypothetical protein
MSPEPEIKRVPYTSKITALIFFNSVRCGEVPEETGER